MKKYPTENNERLQKVNYIKIRMTKYHQAANNSNNNTNENELVKAQQFICIKCIFLFVLLTMCVRVCVCVSIVRQCIVSEWFRRRWSSFSIKMSFLSSDLCQSIGARPELRAKWHRGEMNECPQPNTET